MIARTKYPEAELQPFLRSSSQIDSEAESVRALAQELASGHASDVAKARACFEWVRDEVRHSHDHACNPVTCRASEVLQYRTGYCYAKSHLLAAFLRALGIPAGLCYQRLSIDESGQAFCLHGLNAVLLEEHGWYLADPRGNKEGIHAAFDPPQERLAFPKAV